jgi:hypothetical protein
MQHNNARRGNLRGRAARWMMGAAPRGHGAASAGRAAGVETVAGQLRAGSRVIEPAAARARTSRIGSAANFASRYVRTSVPVKPAGADSRVQKYIAPAPTTAAPMVTAAAFEFVLAIVQRSGGPGCQVCQQQPPCPRPGAEGTAAAAQKLLLTGRPYWRVQRPARLLGS